MLMSILLVHVHKPKMIVGQLPFARMKTQDYQKTQRYSKISVVDPRQIVNRLSMIET